MKKLELSLQLWQIHKDELDETRKKLVLAAQDAARKAYAPYSTFNVGAAVLLANGEIIAASNQENAAYPSGLCAERVALFFAGSQYPGVAVEKLVIVVISDLKTPNTIFAPCGACRQVISESQNRQEVPMEILFEGPDDYFTLADSIQQIMPFTFRLNK
jgi:cytidine deaminase